MHYIEEKDEAFETVEVDVGCHEERIVSPMDCVGGSVERDSSMALMSITLFWKSRQQRTLRCVVKYQLRKLELRTRLR